MEQSFLKKYLQIYFWLTISLILNFASLFIVTPMLSSTPSIYGVYILCISSTIFLSYADLGFVGAGYKYASESYARNEHDEVIKIVGFVTAVLLVFVALYSVVMFVFSWQPRLIINNIPSGIITITAQKLFLILGIFSPIIVLQRSLQIIFGVRVEDYIIQRVNIIGSILKILSVLYFFRLGNYDIVGYFLFFQIVNVATACTSVVIAKFRYGYHLMDLILSIRFSSEYFKKMKDLAFSSLLSIVAWVLFYEMDPFAISHLLGTEKLAVYAIGLSLMAFLRSLFGILFNPFCARFNHFVGTGDTDGLRSIFLHVLQLTLPLCILPLFALELLIKPFIYCWVGPAYQSSVLLSGILLASYVFSFVSYPSGILLLSQKRVKENNILSICTMVLFWFGIFLTIGKYDILSFAICKMAIFAISGLFYGFVAMKFIGKSLSRKFILESVLPLIVPIIIIGVQYWFIEPILPGIKGKRELFIVLAALVGMSGSSLVAYVLFSPVHRLLINNVTGLLWGKQHVHI